MKLSSKKALITGASHGLGRKIAEVFASEGADVLICGRNSEDLAAAQRDIVQTGKGRVLAQKADISVESDVNDLVGVAERELGGVDILVCNAGVYGPKGAIDEVEWDQWRQAIEINLIGAVLCCRSLLKLLRKSSAGKIILLSGGGATKPMPFLSAYAASKAAVVRFAETLAEELRAESIDVNSVAPGALNTRMLQEILDAGPERVGDAYFNASLKQRDSGGSSLETAAALCLYLAGEESNGITGKLISAVWDPWRTLDEHRDDLSKTDVFTLRRIVPHDRDLHWD